MTPYVDGELGRTETSALERHLRACQPCRERVVTERAMRDLLRERRQSLHVDQAPDLLRAQCVALAAVNVDAASPADPLRPAARPAAAATLSSWRPRLVAFAAAAALVLIVGGAFLYQATRLSSRLMAAELTADHIKCFAMNAVLRTHQSPQTVESSLLSTFGWNTRLPDGPEREGLELVGSRPCLYGEGKVAHIMYRHHGRPVSLFMLPGSERADQVVEIFGHECAIWSAGDRTFVLVARETPSDLSRLATFVHESLR